MAITLRSLDTAAGLADQQRAIQQREELGFRLVAFTPWRTGGTTVHAAAFSQQPGAPSVPITLEILDGALSENAQEAALNKPGRVLVCVGSLLVSGVEQNVAAWRVGA